MWRKRVPPDRCIPPLEQVFAALHLTSLASTRAVIVGQDPYPNPAQAHGLSLSVLPGRRPYSLRKIHDEVQDDVSPRTTGTSLVGDAGDRHGRGARPSDRGVDQGRDEREVDLPRG